MRRVAVLAVVLAATPAVAGPRSKRSPRRPPGPVCTLPAPVAVADTDSPRHVRRVVKLHLPAIQHCYDRAVQRDWTVEGTLTARWRIQPDGSVCTVEVTGIAADPALAACVARELETLQFAPEGDVVDVIYPFRFEVGEVTRRARAAAASEPPPLAAD